MTARQEARASDRAATAAETGRTRPSAPRRSVRSCRPRASARASIWSGPSARRRSARATSPRSRAATSATCRRRSTPRASCATTPPTSGSTPTRCWRAGAGRWTSRPRPTRRKVKPPPQPITAPRPRLQASLGPPRRARPRRHRLPLRRLHRPAARALHAEPRHRAQRARRSASSTPAPTSSSSGHGHAQRARDRDRRRRPGAHDTASRPRARGRWTCRSARAGTTSPSSATDAETGARVASRSRSSPPCPSWRSTVRTRARRRRCPAGVDPTNRSGAPSAELCLDTPKGRPPRAQRQSSSSRARATHRRVARERPVARQAGRGADGAPARRAAGRRRGLQGHLQLPKGRWQVSVAGADRWRARRPS